METQCRPRVRYLDPLQGRETRVTVIVRGNSVVAVEDDAYSIPPEAVVLPGENLLLAPSLADLYSYSGEPGHEDRETLGQLIKTAIAGGFGDIAILPNTDPPLDRPQTLQWLEQRLNQIGHGDFHHQPQSLENSGQFQCHWWGSVTQSNQGKQLTEWGELDQAGVIGFSDGGAIQDWRLLQRALEYGAMAGKPLALVPLNSSLRGNGVMREGPLAIQLGLSPDPVMSETAAIASVLELLPHYSIPVHLMRISTARGVELIAQAKSQGLNCTASVNWHHLLLSNGAIAKGLPPHTPHYDPNLRFDPPLGNEGDRLALIEGVKNGVIDAIAVDHQAFTYEEKTQTFAETPPGAIGYELILPCLWQQLVATQLLTPIQLWRALSVNPRRCLGLPAVTNSRILFDPDLPWTVERGTLQTSAYNSPWWGHSLKGRVVAWEG
ncbi:MULTISPECIES: dihydroorotase [unclassified Synechocystis]|uniref:dihydroorotase n=1 Tax=unclassified Synechocystis TaxID=2640012 RepID=UPI00048E7057|nr:MULTISPECIES: dihydroorotase [unclassified Synechocystis]AIE73705.1 Dihydroorotase [Synechocystis sp. PCC 6714]MCT0252266.1 dihydroorotase [Synechocystis sp. CS-94]